MFLGLIFAIAACFIWGLIFVIPNLLADFSAVEVVLGRYFTYGILSAILLFSTGAHRLKRYTPKAWGVAFLFALLSNLVYYLGVVAGLRFASPTLTVMVVGMAPIVIAMYGNWREREMAYRDLAMPCLWMGVGLILINAVETDWSFKATTIGQYLLGIVGMLIGLFAWSWYAVHNARFLKRHPHIHASEWATVLGVATLIWTLIFGALFALGTHEVQLAKFFTLSASTLRYLGGVTILGVGCSWVGCYLWSRASVHLPVSLVGPLLVFETLFGLLFVFSVEKTLPSWVELTGVAAMLIGILMCVFAFRKKTAHI